MRTIVDRPRTLCLGKRGENLTREFVFPAAARWAQSFKDGAPQLLCRPPGGGPVYPAALDMEDGGAVWRVSQADLARPGCGCCELQWRSGGRVVKSRTYVTFVAEPLTGGEEDPWEAYLEKVLQAGSAAADAARRAENAAVHAPMIRDGTWWVWDAEAERYVDTGAGAAGGGGDGTLDHRGLIFRDADNQHPMGAITGLLEAVRSIPAPVRAISNLELEELLHE